MSSLSALVKELRGKTGAGILDCQKALQDTGSDIEKAIDLLRQKGLAAAQKKAGRETKEGLVSLLYSFWVQNWGVIGSKLRNRLCGSQRRISGLCQGSIACKLPLPSLYMSNEKKFLRML